MGVHPWEDDAVDDGNAQITAIRDGNERNSGDDLRRPDQAACCGGLLQAAACISLIRIFSILCVHVVDAADCRSYPPGLLGSRERKRNGRNRKSRCRTAMATTKGGDTHKKPSSW